MHSSASEAQIFKTKKQFLSDKNPNSWVNFTLWKQFVFILSKHHAHTHTHTHTHGPHCVARSSLSGITACHAYIRMKQAHQTSFTCPLVSRLLCGRKNSMTHLLRRLHINCVGSIGRRPCHSTVSTVEGGTCMLSVEATLQYVEYMNINNSQSMHEREGAKARWGGREAVCRGLFQVRHYFVTTSLHLLSPRPSLCLPLPHTQTNT